MRGHTVAISAGMKRNMRGAILKLVYQRHERQEERFWLKNLQTALAGLDFRAYENVVVELLQDLSDRGFVKFDEKRDGKTGDLQISRIMLTPRGRNVVERIESDPAVDV
jgi:hypothetical protein